MPGERTKDLIVRIYFFNLNLTHNYYVYCYYANEFFKEFSVLGADITPSATGCTIRSEY